MVGMAIASVVLVSMEWPEIWLFFVTFLVLGLSLGVTQWLTLRDYIQITNSWILATVIGFSLFGGIIAVGRSSSNSDFIICLFSLWLLSPGFAQWLVLRRQVKLAGCWIPANAIGLVIGFSVTATTFLVGAIETVVRITFLGTIYGTITGAVLVWLLRNPSSQRAALPQSTSNIVTIKATQPTPVGVFGFLRSERKRREVASCLQRIQSEISRLQSEHETLSKRNKAPLAKRDQLDVEISRLIQLDAKNLGLRVDDDRKKASRLEREHLHEREKQLDQELQNLERAKREAQRQLENTVREVEAFKAQRREMGGHLQHLERDPNANVVLRDLRESWEGMSEAELERQIVKSDIEHLYRDQLLLGHLIQNANLKIDELRRVIGDPIAEAVLLLEKHTLERENLERDFQRDLSRHSEINARLQQLQPEYRELEQLNRNLIVATYRERRIARVITLAISISLLILIVVAMMAGVRAYQTHQKEQIYQQALTALEAGQWETARARVGELSSRDNNYKDARTLMLESYYRPAVQALEAGQWQTARAELQQLSIYGDYRDTHTLLCESYYRPAVAALEAGEWEEARAELQQLTSIDSNYKDAQTLLRESYYRPAVAAIETSQWDAAAEAIIQLGRLDLTYKDTPDLIATYAELDRALARRPLASGDSIVMNGIKITVSRIGRWACAAGFAFEVVMTNTSPAAKSLILDVSGTSIAAREGDSCDYFGSSELKHQSISISGRQFIMYRGRDIGENGPTIVSVTMDSLTVQWKLR
ncbi:MAG: hypothetical protein KJ760_19690 [Proteobacteria bacterium]|nr:hypothetical protein [Pseudomonadota bacterium]